VSLPPLSCSVRDCGLPLEPEERRVVCARGHSYDVARSGYINLLQPQDRKSVDAGDTRAVVDARARLLAAGVGRALVTEVCREVERLALPPAAVVVDLGSGSGDALAAVADRHPINAVGIDLSVAAADLAARRFPGIAWVVANADRRLPILDGCAHLVLSLHGRRNPSECARILAPGGAILMAVPAADDLVELRERIQGEGTARDRIAVLLELHRPIFTVVGRSTVRDRLHLSREAILDLLQTTYRGGRTSERDRVEALTDLDVTVASDLVLLTSEVRPG
jgi:23S rRNA (guanine745-N1)-methyltransferase